MKHFSLFAALSFLVTVAFHADGRTWTDTSGTYKVEADFQELADGKVRLKKDNGTNITIPLSKLSQADQDFVKQTVEVASAPAAAPTPAADRPAEKGDQYFPLAVGTAWKYRLHIPKATRVYFNPYFVGALGLLGSNLTHGGRDFEATDATFTIKIVEKIGDRLVKVEVTQLERNVLLPSLKFQEYRMVRFHGDSWGLGLWGVLPSKNGEKPLIVGRDLASTPEKGSSPAEETMEVKAGKFTGVLHCRMPQNANGNYTPAFLEESWIAPEVGVVKFVGMDAQKNVLYTIELVEHTPPAK